MQIYKGSVEAKFEVDGTIRPLAFVWKGRTMRITDWGRQWEKEECRHFLVMTIDDRIWELRFMPLSLEWSIQERHKTHRMI